MPAEWREAVKPTPPSFRDYRGAKGEVTVYLETIGGMWGYTVWSGGRCVAGEKDWNWMRCEARDRADAKVRELCGDPA